MDTFQAEDYEISIADGIWRLLPSAEDLLTVHPVFEMARGAGVMEYTPEFGEARKLPGTVLSIEYVRAVVIGYDERVRRWLLGLHIAQTGAEKPRWVELVRWPEGDNALYMSSAQHAGRALAEHVGCPLKIFGAKKRPQASPAGATQSGVTGPLVPHRREDIGPERVRLFAQSVRLPIQYPGIWLGQDRDGIALRLSRDVTTAKRGGIAPSFNQCVVDPKRGTIRLVPPTGLLGAFVGGARARVLRTSDVRNVELRHTISHEHIPQEEGKDLITEVMYRHYTWDVYLTLPDESLLLAQTRHSTSGELLRRRAMAGDKFAVDTKSGIDYLRQHQADQEAYEAAETFARTVGVVLASTLGVHLVKTQVEEAP